MAQPPNILFIFTDQQRADTMRCYGNEQIQVPAFNALALGAVQTEMLEAAFPGYQAPVSAAEMAKYIGDFALTGHHYYNGKVLQVSKTTP